MKVITKDKLVHSYSRRHPPVEFVRMGESFKVETHERFSAGKDLRKTMGINKQFVTGVTGPIAIENAKKGCALKVIIKKIELTEDFGAVLSVPNAGAFGHLVKKEKVRICPIKDNYAMFSSNMKVPLKPHVGRLAVAPRKGTFPTATLGSFGGNMDNNHIRKGASVYFPVFVDEAMLCLGDVHACMGDGESNLSGLETSARVTLSCGVIDDLEITHPMIENKREIITTGDSTNLYKACKIALHNMAKFLSERTALSFTEAGELISIAADLRICQIVNPRFGAKAIIAKEVVGELL